MSHLKPENRDGGEDRAITRVERLLRAAATDSDAIAEVPEDLVTRALRRAPAPRRVIRGVNHAWVGIAGVAMVSAGLVVTAPILQKWTPVTTITAPTSSPISAGIQRTAAPTIEGSRDTHPMAIELPVTRPAVAQLHPTARRRRRRHRTPRQNVQVAVAVVPSARTPGNPDKPRPFWHDEQVERDDFVGYAPAVIAEGDGSGVKTVQPAIVQVSFSTTHPIGAVVPLGPGGGR